jgi:hypothetical protein
MSEDREKIIPHPIRNSMRVILWGFIKIGEAGSSEVQEFCHYYNDTLLSDTYAFD